MVFLFQIVWGIKSVSFNFAFLSASPFIHPPSLGIHQVFVVLNKDLH